MLIMILQKKKEQKDERATASREKKGEGSVQAFDTASLISLM